MAISQTDASPLVLINAVGLTTRWLAHAPRLRALAEAGWRRTLKDVWPAVTCTAQATILTGKPPSGHGVVANGWLFRDTREVRFWQQSNALLQAEPFYAEAKRLAALRGRSFSVAKLFWWFNQGSVADLSLTPKPHYGADGKKVFGISGTPHDSPARFEGKLGVFPFHTFWGPRAGLPCTAWIARAAAHALQEDRPDLTLVYLPHLDYDPQRFGPSGCDMAKLVGELDQACEPLLDQAKRAGAAVWVVSEYGHCDVRNPVLINQALRRAKLLTARDGPFGEALETFQSRAFAVCDHQLAHIYISDPERDLQAVRDVVAGLPGVARTFAGAERAEIGLDHPRSGELVAISEPDAWFAYPYWLDERRAPDFARTVDIHRKPGYDPCELLLDPELMWAKGRVIHRLIQKKLGFRMLMDVIPLDPHLVKGSHGLAVANDEDRPILIGDGPAPRSGPLEMTEVRGLALRALGFSG